MDSPQYTQLQLGIFFFNFEKRPDLIGYKLLDNVIQLEGIIPSITNYPTWSDGHTKVDNISVIIANRNFNIVISHERLDLYYNRESITEENNIENDYISTSNQIIKLIAPSGIKRVGIVRTAFIDSIDCDDYIKNNFLNTKMQNCIELGIRFNKQFEYNNTIINRIINIYKGKYNVNGINKIGTLFNKDINNIPSISPLTEEYLTAFFDKFVNQDVREL